MQDEVSKHTKKIYKTIIQPQHTFGEKIKEVAIEIFIIVFAVTLSIWLHEWSEHRHEQKEAAEFLRGLKIDLGEDIKLLEDYKSVSIKINSNFAFLYLISKQTPVADTAMFHHLYFESRTTHPKIGRYEGFKSSGKISTIENDSLKQNILTFYEQTIPDLVDGESYTNSLQTRILDLQINRPEDTPILNFVTSQKIKSLFNLGIQNFHSNIAQYNRAIALSKKIIAEIDRGEQE